MSAEGPYMVLYDLYVSRVLRVFEGSLWSPEKTQRVMTDLKGV